MIYGPPTLEGIGGTTFVVGNVRDEELRLNGVGIPTMDYFEPTILVGIFLSSQKGKI